MSNFIYKDYSCEFTFGDKKYELPLSEQTADVINKVFFGKLNPPTEGGIEEINAFYDEVLDAVDEVLGEGAADDIMSGFKHPGVMELLSVVNYIITEFNEQYAKTVEEMKGTAHLPNRETRRARSRR